MFSESEEESEVADSVAAPVRTTVPPSAAAVACVTSLVTVTPLPPNAVTPTKSTPAVEVFVECAVALRVVPWNVPPLLPADVEPATFAVSFWNVPLTAATVTPVVLGWARFVAVAIIVAAPPRVTSAPLFSSASVAAETIASVREYVPLMPLTPTVSDLGVAVLAEVAVSSSVPACSSPATEASVVPPAFAFTSRIVAPPPVTLTESPVAFAVVAVAVAVKVASPAPRCTTAPPVW